MANSSDKGLIPGIEIPEPKPLEPLGYPWSQRDNESSEAFQAFLFYRDHGRKIDRVYVNNLRIPTTQAKQLFDEFEWRARVRAYDAYFEEIRREEREAQEREAARLETEVTTNLGGLLARETSKKLEESERSEESTLRMGDVLKLFEALKKQKQLDGGKPTDIVKVDVDGLPLERLKEIRNAARKAQGKT